MMTAVEAITTNLMTDRQSCSMSKGKQPMSTPIVETGETIANSHELNYNQFSRLHSALSNPRNASTTNTAQIVPWVYISSLHTNLTQGCIGIKSINLEGSAAAHVLDDTAFPSYNDLDIVFHLQSQDRVDLCKVRDVVLDTLTQMEDFAACDRWGVLSKMWISPPRRRNTDDAWAIFTLGSPVSGSSIDLKFVQHLNRPYQFSIDSFYLDVTGLLGNKNFLSWVCPVEKASCKLAVVVDTPPKTQPRVMSWAQIASQKNQAKKVAVAAAAASSPSKTPTPKPEQETIRIIDGPEPHTLVKADCHYPNFDEALLHLKHKRICVMDEDELAQVRGGGLLKYITYTQRGFRDDESVAPTRLAKYMVTRFLMDFPPFETNQMGGFVQLQILVDYVYTHICGPDIESTRAKRHDFLKSLEHLVQSICAFVNHSPHLIDTIKIIKGLHFTPHPIHRDQDDSDSCSMTSENSEEVCDSLLITPTIVATNTNTSTGIATANASTNTNTNMDNANITEVATTTTTKAPTIACDDNVTTNNTNVNTTTNVNANATTANTTKPPSFSRQCRSSSSSDKTTNTNKSLPGKSKTKDEFQTRRSKSLKERNSLVPATTTSASISSAKSNPNLTTTTNLPVTTNATNTPINTDDGNTTNNNNTDTNNNNNINTNTNNGVAVEHTSMLDLTR